jgi:hypothetical protein
VLQTEISPKPHSLKMVELESEPSSLIPEPLLPNYKNSLVYETKLNSLRKKSPDNTVLYLFENNSKKTHCVIWTSARHLCVMSILSPIAISNSEAFF